MGMCLGKKVPENKPKPDAVPTKPNNDKPATNTTAATTTTAANGTHDAVKKPGEKIPTETTKPEESPKKVENSPDNNLVRTKSVRDDPSETSQQRKKDDERRRKISDYKVKLEERKRQSMKNLEANIDPRKVENSPDNEDNSSSSSGSLSVLLAKLRDGEKDVDAVNELDNLEKELREERAQTLSGEKTTREIHEEEVDMLLKIKKKKKHSKHRSKADSTADVVIDGVEGKHD